MAMIAITTNNSISVNALSRHPLNKGVASGLTLDCHLFIANPFRNAEATGPPNAFGFQEEGAIAGIGHPERFFNALMARGLNINPMPFPDHHDYSLDDFPVDAPMLMTEKDAVKCRELGLKDAWCVPVDAAINENLFDAIDSRLKALSS